MILVDGKKIAEKIEKSLFNSRNKGGLAVILVGNDPASHIYVSKKEQAAKRIGIKFEKNIFQKIAKEKEIISKIKILNKRKDITGIIVQLPLPKHLDTNNIIKTIAPKKDADGYHPKNIEKFKKGEFSVIPPVLCAVIKVLKHIKCNPKNKKILLISNSIFFPIPFQAYFKNIIIATSKNYKKYSQKTDIIITAIGKAHYLKANAIKKDVIIIDVGIVRKNKKVFGDADAQSIFKKAKYFTPVPGGIGPITVSCLLKNVIKND